MQTTKWKPCPGLEKHYKISDCGEIIKTTSTHKTFPVGMTMKTQMGHRGYLHLCVSVDGVRSTIKVHRLVALAFLDAPPPNAREVNHKNGIKTDNRACNLEWCTRSENILHAYRMGLKDPMGGERSPHAKITAKQAREIMWRVKDNGETRIAVSADYGISMSSVSRIVRGSTWKNLTATGRNKP